MNARIKQILEKKGLTSGEFAKQVGIQPGAVSHLLSGRNNPSLDVVQKILNAFRDISPDWFLFGSGSMLRGEKLPYVQTTLFPLNDESEELDNQEKNDMKEPEIVEKSASLTSPELKNPCLIDTNTEKCKTHDLVRIIAFYSDGTFEELKK